jgi:nitrite reductase/ring-hydroxylating ferredoxin subunit
MDTVATTQMLCRLDDIADGGATAVDTRLADDEAAGAPSSVILLRHGGEVRGYLNVCPHAGRRLDYAPGKFLLKNGTLTCAVHGASFNQSSGLCIGGPCCGDRLREVAVQVQDGVVQLAPEA